jgi:hypothetical protein
LRVITEFVERRDMRMVNGFITAFVPIGWFACAISPLVNTALDLTTENIRVRAVKPRVGPILTAVRARAMARVGIGVKYSEKTIPSPLLS